MKSISNLCYYIVFVLLICSNIVNTIFVKDAWSDAGESGWQFQISKGFYGLIIIIMLMSITKEKMFRNLRFFSYIIIVYILLAYALQVNFELGVALKHLLICLSFPFFSSIRIEGFKMSFIKIFAISAIVNTTYLVLSSNMLLKSIENDSYGTGQSTSLTIIYLLPIIFLLFKDKIGSYFYLYGLIIVIISLRRTSILAYLLCLPFLFRRISNHLSKWLIFVLFSIFTLLLLYIAINYGDVLSNRFSDMFEADKSGNYGSGRTAFFSVLFDDFYNSPMNWLFGFGLGSVAEHLDNAGFAIGHAHSDYTEIGFTYGVVGLALWLYTFFSIFKLKKSHYISRDERTLMVMILISMIFISFITNMIDNPSFISVPISIGLIYANEKANRLKIKNEK